VDWSDSEARRSPFVHPPSPIIGLRSRPLNYPTSSLGRFKPPDNRPSVPIDNHGGLAGTRSRARPALARCAAARGSVGCVPPHVESLDVLVAVPWVTALGTLGHATEASRQALFVRSVQHQTVQTTGRPAIAINRPRIGQRLPKLPSAYQAAGRSMRHFRLARCQSTRAHAPTGQHCEAALNGVNLGGPGQRIDNSCPEGWHQARLRTSLRT
jgi:hypothetical protein